MFTKYDTIINDISIYSWCIEFSWKSAKVEMEKITYSIEKNDKYTNTKNYTDNKCAKIMSYIQKCDEIYHSLY